MACFRSVAAVASVGMVLAIVAGCSPTDPAAPVPFGAGRWSDPDTGATLVLNADGSGSSVALEVVPISEFLSCDPRARRDTYSGLVTWKEYDGGEQFVLAVEPVNVADPATILFHSRMYRPEDWSKIIQWPCGDPDTAPAQTLTWVPDVAIS